MSRHNIAQIDPAQQFMKYHASQQRATTNLLQGFHVTRSVLPVDRKARVAEVQPSNIFARQSNKRRVTRVTMAGKFGSDHVPRSRTKFDSGARCL